MSTSDPVSPVPEARPSSLDAESSQLKKKRKRRGATAPVPPPPDIASKPLTVPVTFNGLVTSLALIDSGAQAEVLSPRVVHALHLDVRRLDAPIHAALAAKGEGVRLSLFTAVTIEVGEISVRDRSVFIAPLPPGIDAILGTPWMAETGTCVSSRALSYAPEGLPSSAVYDFDLQTFVPQPLRNLTDLGFVDSRMSDMDLHTFLVCAVHAGVEQAHLTELMDTVEIEPHNVLLDELDNAFDGPDLTSDEAARALELIMKAYSDIFVDELPGLPPFRPINHEIKLIDKDKHVRPRAIPMPDRYSAQWTAHVRKFTESGFWSPEALESACSMFAVPKHDRTQARFVINLKPRNENTAKAASPIPDMKAVRYRLASHPYRSKLDFKNAYEQAIGRFLDVFFDDVFVYSLTRRDHVRHLEIVFGTLRHYQFFLSRSKVEFFSPKLEVLGMVVDDDGLHVSQDKLEMIRNWPTPRTPKDILRFQGVMGWMRDHFPRLQEVMAPLSRLTGKVPWDWSPACELAFETLKAMVPRTLKPLDITKIDNASERLFLVTDASIYGCGGWLGQGPSLDQARPFRFFSSKFNPAQRNYSTTDQELLGVFVGTRKMHEHLIGFKFTVCCDHEPLKTYWTQPPKQERRHVRLWETLSQYDFDWMFTPGRVNVLANALSRIAEADPEIDLPVADEPTPATDDPEPFTTEPRARPMVLAGLMSALEGVHEPAKAKSFQTSPPLSLSAFSPSSWLTSSSFPSLLSDLKTATASDTLCSKILATPTAYPAFAVEDGLVYHRVDDSVRLVLPSGRLSPDSVASDAELRPPPTFVELACESAHQLVGHQGFKKTLSFARGSFWWPTMVGIDFLVSLPPVTHLGNPVDSILTVTDYLSKFVILIPLPSTATAEQVAAAFVDAVVRRFGLPEAIVSDRDPKFTGSFWQALMRRMGVKLRMSTSAHPQTDGQAESTNRTVGQVLRTLCEDDPDAWASHLAACEYALNASIAASTGVTPFEVVHGFSSALSPLRFGTSADESDPATVSTFAQRAELSALRASDAILASRIRMVFHENKHRRDDAPLFAFVGPFDIIASDRATSTYTLALPPHLNIHPRVHASKLRQHLPNDDVLFPSRALSLPPPAIPATDGNNEEWFVEKIVGEKGSGARLKYKVRYLGYSAADDQWRPAAELLATAKETVDALYCGFKIKTTSHFKEPATSGG
ncbi:hypothetical protein JCM3774_004861 [Rhodotorula dairenensis]